MGKEHELLEAARCGNVSIIEKMIVTKTKKTSGHISFPFGLPTSLKRQVNVNCYDTNGDSPIHLAALNGHEEAVHILLIHDANQALIDQKGCTALHLAAWNGNTHICNLLLTCGQSRAALINMQNNEGDTALHCASQYGHSDTVLTLLEHRADPFICNLSGQSALDLAAQYGRLDVVQQLISRKPSLLANQAKHKLSPLHLAARSGHRDIAEELLNAGFDINFMYDGSTALHKAAMYCKVDVIKLLIDRGINLHIKDKDNSTAVDLLENYNSQAAQDAIALIKHEMKHPTKQQSKLCTNLIPFNNSIEKPQLSNQIALSNTTTNQIAPSITTTNEISYEDEEPYAITHSDELNNSGHIPATYDSTYYMIPTVNKSIDETLPSENPSHSTNISNSMHSSEAISSNSTNSDTSTNKSDSVEQIPPDIAHSENSTSSHSIDTLQSSHSTNTTHISNYKRQESGGPPPPLPPRAKSTDLLHLYAQIDKSKTEPVPESIVTPDSGQLSPPPPLPPRNSTMFKSLTASVVIHAPDMGDKPVPISITTPAFNSPVYFAMSGAKSPNKPRHEKPPRKPRSPNPNKNRHTAFPTPCSPITTRMATSISGIHDLTTHSVHDKDLVLQSQELGVSKDSYGFMKNKPATINWDGNEKMDHEPKVGINNIEIDGKYIDMKTLETERESLIQRMSEKEQLYENSADLEEKSQQIVNLNKNNNADKNESESNDVFDFKCDNMDVIDDHVIEAGCDNIGQLMTEEIGTENQPGSRPPSLVLDSSQRSLIRSVIDPRMSPGVTPQLPTPDHPPPSPHTAARGILDQIRPLSLAEKRLSRDIDTMTEVVPLADISETNHIAGSYHERQGSKSIDNNTQSTEENHSSTCDENVKVNADDIDENAVKIMGKSDENYVNNFEKDDIYLGVDNKNITNNHGVSGKGSKLKGQCSTETLKGNSFDLCEMSESIEGKMTKTGTLTRSDKKEVKSNNDDENDDEKSDVSKPSKPVKKTRTSVKTGRYKNDSERVQNGENSFEESENEKSIGDSSENLSSMSDNVFENQTIELKVTEVMDGCTEEHEKQDLVEEKTLNAPEISVVAKEKVKEVENGGKNGITDVIMRKQESGSQSPDVSQFSGLFRGSKIVDPNSSSQSSSIAILRRSPNLAGITNFEAVTEADDDNSSVTMATVKAADKKVEDDDEWSQIAEIMESFGGCIGRESVFVRDFETEFNKFLATGTERLKTIGDWLETLGLLQYENLLVANGFDDLDFVGTGVLERTDLEQIGVKVTKHQDMILESGKSLPTVTPIDPDNLPSTVESWLESLRLSEYIETFESHSYSEMTRVVQLWELELTTVLDITTLGHRKRILSSLGDRSRHVQHINASPKTTAIEPLHNLEWQTPQRHNVPQSPKPSPIDGVDFFKDYSKVRPVTPINRTMSVPESSTYEVVPLAKSNKKEVQRGELVWTVV